MKHTLNSYARLLPSTTKLFYGGFVEKAGAGLYEDYRSLVEAAGKYSIFPTAIATHRWGRDRGNNPFLVAAVFPISRSDYAQGVTLIGCNALGSKFFSVTIHRNPGGLVWEEASCALISDHVTVSYSEGYQTALSDVRNFKREKYAQ